MLELVRGGVSVVAIGTLTLSIAGCGGMTREEAAAALDEASLAAEASALIGGTIEVTTELTIGAAVESAAAELRTFVESQLPRAEATLEGATLTIVYGARPGTCTYRGQTYAGTHRITITSNQMDDVVVAHTWTDLRNARVSVSGSAMVTWSFADRTRHVSHELTWTRLSDGASGTGTGERAQAALDGGITEGFRESGERTWTSARGTWSLSIADVQMRWIGPCPEAGSYVLTSPQGDELSLTFSRLDADTIHVTMDTGGRRGAFELDVTTAP